jgi:hypothetical protein
MKKAFVMATVIVLAMYAAVLAGNKFIVDNTPDKNPAACGGWWYSYNDSSSGGNSEVTFTPGKMSGKTGNKLGWDYIGMGLTLGEKCGCYEGKGAVPVDLTGYKTLSFKIKGSISGGRLTLAIPYSANECQQDAKTAKSLTDYADYEVALNKYLSKDGETVKIDLREDLKQPKWAKKTFPIEEVLKNAHNINFHFSSPDGDTVNIAVSDIAFE